MRDSFMNVRISFHPPPGAPRSSARESSKTASSRRAADREFVLRAFDGVVAIRTVDDEESEAVETLRARDHAREHDDHLAVAGADELAPSGDAPVSPSCRADICTLPTSEPACGSVIATAPLILPLMRPGTQAFRCSSVPKRMIIAAGSV